MLRKKTEYLFVLRLCSFQVLVLDSEEDGEKKLKLKWEWKAGEFLEIIEMFVDLVVAKKGEDDYVVLVSESRKFRILKFFGDELSFLFGMEEKDSSNKKENN